jgi:hypothetical protein
MTMSAWRVFKMGAVVGLMALAGCGGSSSGDAGVTTYTLGGVVLGLESGGTVEVVANGSETLSETSNGPFTFPTQLPSGANYSVTLGTMPTGQSCGVLNGGGSVDYANTTDVEVYCTVNVSAATLDGTYEIAAFNINADNDQLFSAVPFNGNGTQGSSSVVTNQAGTTFSTSTDAGGSYTVATVDAVPVGLSQAATPSDSEGSVAISADGSFTGTQSTLDVSGDGVSNTTVSGAAGSYAVANNVVSIGGQSGYISANGEFAILTPVTQQPGGASANYPGLTAAVKQGSGVTLATVNGVYSIANLSYASASTGDGGVFTLFFDGAGNISGTVTGNDDGVYGTGTFSGTYTVTSTGVLTLTDSSGNVYTGGMSADGKVVVAAYLTPSAGAPEIFVGFRQ